MRSHLLWYTKNKYAHKYHKFHTRNGVIKFKDKCDNTNNGSWKSIENPDDLHALVGDDHFDPVLFNSIESKPPVKIFTTSPVPALDEFVVDVNEDDTMLVLPESI